MNVLLIGDYDSADCTLDRDWNISTDNIGSK